MSELRSKLESSERNLANLRLNLRKIEQQVAVEDERVMLLRRLMELNQPGLPQSAGGEREHFGPGGNPSKTLSHARLEDAVVSILSNRDEAVHIGEIRSKLVERGIRIPGKGTDSNIIARIIKEPRIEREAGRRGYYRLRQA